MLPPRKMITDLVEVLLLRPLKLLLEEQDDLLHIPTSSHVEHNADGLPANLQVSTSKSSQYSDWLLSKQLIHIERIWRMSMTRGSKTCPCLERSVSSRSRTISLALLSAPFRTSCTYDEAAAARTLVNSAL